MSGKELHKDEAPPPSLGDFNSAARTKEAVHSIAKSAVYEVYQPPREAEFVAYDFWARLIELKYPGETETFIVEYPGTIMPYDFAGRLTPITVRVAGTHGDRYIEETYGPSQYYTYHENWGTVINPDGLQTYAAGSFFPNSQWPADPTMGNGAFTTAPFTIRDNEFTISEGFGTCVHFQYDIDYYIQLATQDFVLDTALGGHTAAFRLKEFGVSRAILATGTGATDPEGLVMGKGFQIEMGGETGAKVRFTNAGFDKATISNAGYLTTNDAQIGDGLSNDSLTIHGFSVPRITFERIDPSVSDRAYIEAGTNMNIQCQTGTINFMPANASAGRFNADGTFEMLGNAIYAGAAGQALRVGYAYQSNPYASFYTFTTRRGYVQALDATAFLRVAGDDGIQIWAQAGTVDFYANAAFAARFDTGGSFLINKTAQALTSTGVELLATGRIYGTVPSATDINMILNITSGAAGDTHILFRHSNTTHGSITQVAGPATAYNTTSTGLLKNKIKMASDDEFLALIMDMPLWWYSAKEDKRNGPMWGVMTEELEKVAPWLVTKGKGKPGDVDFVPDMTDYGRVASAALGGVQGLTLHVVQHRVDIDGILKRLDAAGIK